MVVIVEEALRGVRFFEFLTEEEREEFAEGSETASFGPGEVLIEEGRDPGSLFVLTSGWLEVRKMISGHGDRLLARIDAAEVRTVVGGWGVLYQSGASARVVASGSV